jgi:hypothetical protein
MSRFAIFLDSAALCWMLATNSPAQASPAESKPGQVEKTHAPIPSKKVFEDEEVRILVPPGWEVMKVGSPDDPLAAHPPAVAQTFIPSPGRGLLLSSRGYTLALAYETGHAGPIKGGRFTDLFSMPWISDASEMWACGDYLRRVPQPASRELLFVNLSFGHPDPEIREKCGIPENVHIDRHWFGGYFSTAGAPYFFNASGADCAMKAYTLTSDAKTPDEMPMADDPALRKIISEAIAIVTSVHYKRCPPLSDHKK